MKINYVSDLHTEFDSVNSIPLLRNEVGADVLILAGDISVKARTGYIEEVAQYYEHVVYVMGNHEYYRGRYPDTLNRIKSFFKNSNVHVLENESLLIKERVFHGATLWTDGGNNPVTISRIDGELNDFRLIRTEGGISRFSAQFSTEIHKESVEYLRNNIKKKDVVVTHHAPSFRSLHPRYKNDTELNSAYMSDLEELIEDLEPELWFHGHVHDSFDYTVGKTRILCNPRGYYNYQENPKFELYATIEI